MSNQPNLSKKIKYILRFYRRREELSQFDMSSLLNISPRNYQRLEMGEVEPKLETLNQISHVLSVPITSLISFADDQCYDMNQLLSSKERLELSAHKIFRNEDLQFALKLVQCDKKNPDILGGSDWMMAEVAGLHASMDDKLARKLNLLKGTINVSDYLINAHIIDRWETVFRLNLKKVLIESSYLFPCGLKVLQSFHYEIFPTPDSPRSKCYVRDVTNRYNLENWIQNYSNIKYQR